MNLMIIRNIKKGKKMEPTSTDQDYDRASELKAFDETKAGVKGLVDAGIASVPRIFINPCDEKYPNQHTNELKFPIIDLNGADEDPRRREMVIKQIVDAAERWGFFQVINHGIPLSMLDEMMNGVRRFHEQDTEVKKQWYTRDETKAFVYNSSFDLYSSEAASWRDTFYFVMAPDGPNPEVLPEPCRDVMVEYPKQVKRFGCRLLKLLSEGLGLEPNHLKDMGCAEGLTVAGHYYPPCPQPELAFGISKHVDGSFMTVVLQDEIGGLQVLHQNQWVDVPPTRGALVVNVGDLLQLITNDKFKSAEHRVLANDVGPRVSVACFFTTNVLPTSNVIGPIKELLSEDNPPKYRETTATEYAKCYYAEGHGVSTLLHFKI